MKRRLKVYFIHSTKVDYKNLIYRDVVSSPICTLHELMFPQTKTYETRYYKELIEEADIIIADVSKSSFGLKLELKELLNCKKPIKYISLNNTIPRGLKKLVPEIEPTNESKSLIHIIETFIKKYASMTYAEYKNPIIVLGDL